MTAADEIDPLEAMARYAAGDAGAFPIVHNYVTPVVLAVLRRHLSDRDLVQDAVQATFMRAHRARKSFRRDQGVGALRPWFATLARRVALDMLRGRGRAQRRIARAHREMDWLDRNSGERPDERWEDFQQKLYARKMLTDMMQHLPSSQREALHMHVVQGETFTSMADLLGLSATNLRVRAHRARTAIRRMAERVYERRQMTGEPAEPAEDRELGCTLDHARRDRSDGSDRDRKQPRRRRAPHPGAAVQHYGLQQRLHGLPSDDGHRHAHEVPARSCDDADDDDRDQRDERVEQVDAAVPSSVERDTREPDRAGDEPARGEDQQRRGAAREVAVAEGREQRVSIEEGPRPRGPALPRP